MSNLKNVPFGGDLNNIISLIVFHQEQGSKLEALKRSELENEKKYKILAMGNPLNQSLKNDLIKDAGKEDFLLANHWKDVLKQIELKELKDNGFAVPSLTANKTMEVTDKAAEVIKSEPVATVEEKPVVETNKTVEEPTVENTVEESTKPVVEEVVTTDPVVAKEVPMEIVHNSISGDEKPVLVSIPDVTKEEITKLYSTKGLSKVIEGEITEEDRKNPLMVIETRDNNAIEIKRMLSGKELAYNEYKKILIVNEIDPDTLSKRSIADDVIKIVNSCKKRLGKEAAEKILKSYNDMKLDTARPSVVAHTDVETLLKAINEESTDFNFNILSSSDIKSQDLRKIKAIQLAANGDFKGAVKSIVLGFEKIDAMNDRTAALFVSNLMKSGAYLEIENAMTTLLLDDKENHLKHVDSITKMIYAFTNWKDGKITNFINDYIEGLKQSNLLPVKANLVNQEPIVVTTAEEGTTSAPSDTVSEETTATDDKTDVKSEESAKTVEPAVSRGESDENGSEESKVVEEQQATTDTKTNAPVLKLVFKQNKKKTVFSGFAEEKDVTFQFAARVGTMEKAEPKIIEKFKNFMTTASHNENIKIPTGFENYKVGDEFTLELIKQSA